MLWSIGKQHLLGAKFLVKTNHNNLKYFLTQKNLSPEQQKWVRKIQAFYFNILYKMGKENLSTYRLLSKHENDATQCAISILIPKWILEIQTEYVENPQIRKLIKEVESNREKNTNTYGRMAYFGTNKGYIFPSLQNSKLKFELRRIMILQQ